MGEQKAYDQKQLALAHKAKGNECYKKRDFDAALKHYDDAIAADPGDVTYRNNKCAVHFEKKDYDAVLSEGREAIKVGREHRADYELVHKIYVRMGKAKMKQGDLEGALEEFNNAQVEHRDKATERLVKNLEMDIKKKKREAYIDPAKALEEKEKGNVKFREGKFSESVPFYEEAMKDPEIQAILQDPMVRQVIQDLSGGNGAAGQQAMNDPVMRGKIEKLIASGVLQTK